MPPAAPPQPDASVVEPALAALKRALVDPNLTARGDVRTPHRVMQLMPPLMTQVDDSENVDLVVRQVAGTHVALDR